MIVTPTEIAEGPIKRIHVNRQRIAANRKRGERAPTLTCKCGKANIYGSSVLIDGPSRLVYRPDSPLPCGAVAWIETKSRVVVE